MRLTTMVERAAENGKKSIVWLHACGRAGK